MSRCKHFTGIQNTTCNVGIFYTTVRDASANPYRWPCTNSAVPCTSRVYPTQEEIDTEERSFNAVFENITTARRAIVAATKGRRDVGGEVPCPVCLTGHLCYTVARSNGHIHAACSTATCVRWME